MRSHHLEQQYNCCSNGAGAAQDNSASIVRTGKYPSGATVQPLPQQVEVAPIVAASTVGPTVAPSRWPDSCTVRPCFVIANVSDNKNKFEHRHRKGITRRKMSASRPKSAPKMGEICSTNGSYFKMTIKLLEQD
jgi:hypothetical protein